MGNKIKYNFFNDDFKKYVFHKFKNEKVWYVLIYDFITSEYYYMSKTATFDEAYNEFLKTNKINKNCYVELIFAPLNNDFIDYNIVFMRR
ncbi:MAG: hypothetical protein ACI35W_05500 [Anaeroplasmataceae bacterium]